MNRLRAQNNERRLYLSARAVPINRLIERGLPDALYVLAIFSPCGAPMLTLI
jgi:hypothetical protein